MISKQAIALTIAGSDCSGGAGIQADLKTFAAFGVYGFSVVTAVTAQNTMGVQDLHELPSKIVDAQLRSVLADCEPMAVKIGMLANVEIVKRVAQSLGNRNQKNIVIDPVMVSTSGRSLLTGEARCLMVAELFPLAEIMTPNIQEAEQLCEMKIESQQDMKSAARKLREDGCRWVVIKGGHANFSGEAIDVAFDGREFHLLRSKRLNVVETHGTGCTFSAAIAAALARGQAPLNALHAAKNYTTRAIEAGLRPGKGSNVPGHFSDLLLPFG